MPALARYTSMLLILAVSFLGALLSDSRRRVSLAIRLGLYVSAAAVGAAAIVGAVPGIDELQGVFLLLTGVVAAPVTLASEGYSRMLFGLSRPMQMLVDPALGLLLAFFLSRNLLELTIMWISVELVVFFLILFERRGEAWGSALRYIALCVTTGDISLFTWIALASLRLGLEKALLSDFSTLAAAGVHAGPVATALLVIGFVTKMALVPLHFWLPDAYAVAAPPVAALMSGVVEKMGLYGLLRVWGTVSLSTSVFIGMLAVLGFLTAVYASLMVAAQTDMRRLLAYSTIMHCGIMALLVALLPCSQAVWWLLALYVLFHGVSKAQLFINTGSVYLLANTTDIHRLGYLARTNPDLYQATVLGASSLMGLPPTLGFAAKALMIYVMFEVLGRGGVYAALYIAAVAVTSVFSIVYSMKYLGVYVGALRGGERPTARLPREQLWAEKALGWLSVALVPMAIAVPVVPAFSLALAAIYVVSLALLLYTFRSGVPRVVPIDEVWLGGVSP